MDLSAEKGNGEARSSVLFHGHRHRPVGKYSHQQDQNGVAVRARFRQLPHEFVNCFHSWPGRFSRQLPGSQRRVQHVSA